MVIDDVIDEVRLDTKMSEKTGRQYKVTVLRLSNGYECKVFLHPAETAVIESLITGTSSK